MEKLEDITSSLQEHNNLLQVANTGHDEESSTKLLRQNTSIQLELQGYKSNISNFENELQDLRELMPYQRLCDWVQTAMVRLFNSVIFVM